MRAITSHIEAFALQRAAHAAEDARIQGYRMRYVKDTSEERARTEVEHDDAHRNASLPNSKATIRQMQSLAHACTIQVLKMMVKKPSSTQLESSTPSRLHLMIRSWNVITNISACENRNHVNAVQWHEAKLPIESSR